MFETIADHFCSCERTSRFTQDLSRWNVSKCKDMTAMFFRANRFAADLSTWDVSSVDDEGMTWMFRGASKFDSMHTQNWAKKPKSPNAERARDILYVAVLIISWLGSQVWSTYEYHTTQVHSTSSFLCGFYSLFVLLALMCKLFTTICTRMLQLFVSQSRRLFACSVR